MGRISKLNSSSKYLSGVHTMPCCEYMYANYFFLFYLKIEITLKLNSFVSLAQWRNENTLKVFLLIVKNSCFLQVLWLNTNMKNETNSEILTLERQISGFFFRGREKPFIAQYHFLSTYNNMGFLSFWKSTVFVTAVFTTPSNLERPVGAEDPAHKKGNVFSRSSSPAQPSMWNQRKGCSSFKVIITVWA